jgi:hypothetical protein
MGWIWWAPLVAATLHIVEEFFWPGGFPEWDRAHRAGIASSITPRLHFWVNAALLVLCAMVGLAGLEHDGVPIHVRGIFSGAEAPAAWLTVTALLFSNAVWHLVGTIRTHTLSPGLRTGLALYVPLTIGGFLFFLRSGQVSAATALLAAAIGGSYHLWAAFVHARRAAARPPAGGRIRE